MHLFCGLPKKVQITFTHSVLPAGFTILYSLLKNVTSQKECPGYDIKLNLMVRYEFWNSEVLFIVIIPSSTLTQSGNTC